MKSMIQSIGRVVVHGLRARRKALDCRETPSLLGLGLLLGVCRVSPVVYVVYALFPSDGSWSAQSHLAAAVSCYLILCVGGTPRQQGL